MLLQDSNKITLKPKMQKILCVSTAFHGTFVVARLDKPGEKESIVHLDKTGKILWEKTYDDIIDFFGMMNDKEVIVLNVKEQKIDIINLETHKILQVNHAYLFEDTASMEIKTFSETRYFAIVERGCLNDNRFRITYYAYDGINEETKPLAVWQAANNEWTYEHTY